MDLHIQPKDPEGLYDTPLLHQTAFWSAVKQKQGIPSLAFELKIRGKDVGIPFQMGSYVVDDILILFQQPHKDISIGYIPYGPALLPADELKGTFLEELSESIRGFLPSSCFMLRYDLPWQSLWAEDEDNYDEHGMWLGPPEPNMQELRFNWGTQTHNLRKATTDILPSDTVLLHLQQDEEELLSSMKPKTRYNILLAQRHGVTVRRGSFADIDLFYELYRQTCIRNRIVLHHRDFFYAMFVEKQETHKENFETHFDLLFAHAPDGEALAALFIVYSSNRATYLFGASSSHQRHLMGTYALQWEAMIRAKQYGCTEYDLFGTPPNGDPSHPMHGLYRFKRGFGGTELHRLGCWDYPLNTNLYEAYSASELVRTGYHCRTN